MSIIFDGLDISGLTPLIDTAAFEPFEPFTDLPSSPAATCDESQPHEEVHPEVANSSFDFLDLTPSAVSPSGSVPASVPDIGTTDMENDDQLLNELLLLDTPAWTVSKETAPPAPPVAEPMAFDAEPEPEPKIECVPEEEPVKARRPKKGPGSRRKLKEEIRDELDEVIYNLFPSDVLRLPREEFQAWREQSGMRRLSVPEQKRLSKIRRMILARVYAERTRLRKIEESKNNGQTLSVLKAENNRLRKKAAKLEAAQTKLQETIRRLIATQKLNV